MDINDSCVLSTKVLSSEDQTKNIFAAIVHKEDEWYVAECPEVGTASQGKTIEEAIANLQEATELYLEEFPQESAQNPILTTFEVPVQATEGSASGTQSVFP